MVNTSILLKVVVAVIILSSCKKEECKIQNDIYMQKFTLKEWEILSGTKVFFGHQSVGNNIIEGINGILDENKIKFFKIHQTRDMADLSNAVFAHALIGKNTNPISKIDDFIDILDSGIADSADIVFMKLCYVDIDRNTNINQLFDYYRITLDSIQDKYPNLKIIHFTVPLTTKPQGIRGFITRFLKHDDNVIRDQFNQLLRRTYDDRELFDLARLESLYPNGTLNIYDKGTPALVKIYSTDGGHLNQHASKMIAQELLERILLVLETSE